MSTIRLAIAASTASAMPRVAIPAVLRLLGAAVATIRGPCARRRRRGSRRGCAGPAPSPRPASCSAWSARARTSGLCGDVLDHPLELRPAQRTVGGLDEQAVEPGAGDDRRRPGAGWSRGPARRRRRRRSRSRRRARPRAARPRGARAASARSRRAGVPAITRSTARSTSGAPSSVSRRPSSSERSRSRTSAPSAASRPMPGRRGRPRSGSLRGADTRSMATASAASPRFGTGLHGAHLSAVTGEVPSPVSGEARPPRPRARSQNHGPAPRRARSSSRATRPGGRC